MKICWDNIENIKLSKNGNFRDIIKKQTCYYKEYCKSCNEPFLSIKKDGEFCCSGCAKSYSNIGKKHTDETKKKISEANKGSKNPMYGRVGKDSPNFGKKRSNKVKKKMSEANKGSKNPFWKGGCSSKGIPIYDTYAPQLEWAEEVRRNKEDSNILEVKCFKCNEWFIPTLNQAHHRSQYLKGTKNYNGEYLFYCSNQCKNSCSIFYKQSNTIMKEDAIRAGRLPWLELTREVQPELRSIVLKRDKNRCVKCESLKDLQCHHILPVNIEPLFSADVDNCITLCYTCHKKVHQKDGCRYDQLKVEEC